jgi:hypothetical protein
MKASTYQVRHRKTLAIAIKLDRFDRRVVDHLAMRASTEMLMQNVS